MGETENKNKKTRREKKESSLKKDKKLRMNHFSERRLQ